MHARSPARIRLLLPLLLATATAPASAAILVSSVSSFGGTFSSKNLIDEDRHVPRFTIQTRGWLANGPDGAIYETRGSHVYRIDPDDGSSASFVSAGTTLAGITFGPGGDLWVSDATGGQILRYDGVTGAPLGSGPGVASPGALRFGPGGDLYVASLATDSIHRFDGTTLVPLGTIGAGLGIDRPLGIGFGPGGDLYVSSEAGEDVRRFDPDTGALVGVVVAFAAGTQPGGLAFGPDGDLYVAARGDSLFTMLLYGGVHQVDPATGTILATFGQEGARSAFDLVFNEVFGAHPGEARVGPDGDGTNPLRDPTDAAFAPDGSLWVTGGASDNLFRVEPDGTVVQVLDASGSGGVAFENPQELAVGPDGDVLVATETALLRIFPDGTVQHLFDGSQPRVVWGEPKGIGFDALGNAYGIGVGRTAYRFAPDGTQTILIDWRGDGTNPLTDPSDLAVLPDGTVFVSGEGGDDVFRIEPGGSISRITDSRMAGPIDMAFGPDGTLFIACSASWNVMGLTPTGDVYERANFGSSLQPQQIAIDGDGDVYVGTGSLGGRIAWVGPSGGLVTVVDVADGGLGLSAADLTHLTVDDAGDVYVPGLLANALFRVDVPPECSDGIDNDQDGLVDFPDDPGCRDADWWEDPACDDDIDNDGDGKVDWDGGALGFPPDPTCNGAWEPTERSGCGLGGELALLLPVLARLRRRIRP